MTHRELLHRRTFLADLARIAGAGLVAFDLQLITACAGDDTARHTADGRLTAAEARTLRAFAAQILPSDNDGPGANEAAAVEFIDRAFGMPFFADTVPVVRDGLANLDARANTGNSRQTFASIPSTEQIAIMRQIETTPFFATARTLVVMGTFADPSYGGNRGSVGSSLLGIEHRPSFTAPFGWYDGQTTPHVTSGAA
ncbi:MAG TPA: gluconate 2-dehydrogenase subunit 3 family protein [Gemmatimonadaceae bacterium]|nr:gluconate 2-dehydrogenase subunit 3 family protein [Gemmatimonadaceae bacterium]